MAATDVSEPKNAAYRIDIERNSTGARGSLYRVIHAGEVIIESSRQPLLDAARVFHSAGVKGNLEMWHAGSANAAMRGDIERCAALTVIENEQLGPRFSRWKPMPSAGMAVAAYPAEHTRANAGEVLPA